MKVGVIGTGNIVKTVAPTVQKMDGMECYAIASRTLDKAVQAAIEFGFARAYGSYEELVCDPEVELIYVATPHSRHFEDMKLCITHGKPVLCEKAFTMNAKQAKEIKELSEKHGVFVAEAIWPRYMPSRQLIQETVDSGIIGKVTTLTANLSYVIDHVPRIQLPELAGGALLDIGVYGINFALMHFGKEIERIDSSVQMTETGVDAMETITMYFKGGRMAVLTHSIYSRSDRKGIFHGDKGYIVVENLNNPQLISVYDLNDNLIKQIEVPKQISGYEYEFAEAAECIRNGKIESDKMPLSESIDMMELMDTLRHRWGVVYPQER